MVASFNARIGKRRLLRSTRSKNPIPAQHPFPLGGPNLNYGNPFAPFHLLRDQYDVNTGEVLRRARFHLRGRENAQGIGQLLPDNASFYFTRPGRLARLPVQPTIYMIIPNHAQMEDLSLSYQSPLVPPDGQASWLDTLPPNHKYANAYNNLQSQLESMGYRVRRWGSLNNENSVGRQAVGTTGNYSTPVSYLREASSMSYGVLSTSPDLWGDAYFKDFTQLPNNYHEIDFWGGDVLFMVIDNGAFGYDTPLQITPCGGPNDLNPCQESQYDGPRDVFWQHWSLLYDTMPPGFPNFPPLNKATNYHSLSWLFLVPPAYNYWNSSALTNPISGYQYNFCYLQHLEQVINGTGFHSGFPLPNAEFTTVHPIDLNVNIPNILNRVQSAFSTVSPIGPND